MKTQFLLEEIPKTGLDLLEEPDSVWLGELLLDQYIVDETRIRLTGKLYKDRKGVVLMASFDGTLGFDCSRCAEPSRMQIHHGFTRVFLPAGVQDMAMDLDLPDNAMPIESMEYRGNLIDIGPALAEEFVLMLPEYPLCSVDCKGLCPVCGHNLNQGDCGCDRDVLHNRLKVKPNLV